MKVEAYELTLFDQLPKMMFRSFQLNCDPDWKNESLQKKRCHGWEPFEL